MRGGGDGGEKGGDEGGGGDGGGTEGGGALGGGTEGGGALGGGSTGGSCGGGEGGLQKPMSFVVRFLYEPWPSFSFGDSQF